MTNVLFKQRNAKLFGLLFLFLLLILSIYFSITTGITAIHWKEVIRAYTDFNGSNEHWFVRETRIPRALIAASIGAALAVAGVLMQAVTRNPLASPAIMGVNAGAAFFIVVTVTLFHFSSLTQYAWAAFSGALFTTLIVYLLGSAGRDGLTPVKITLAGAAMTAFLTSITQGILLIDGQSFQQVLYWLVGSVAGRDLHILTTVAPYLLIGLAGAFLLARSINLLAMGEDVAKGLGQRTVLTKLISGLMIVFLAGSAVAVAGPIGFIGIIIPHTSRYLVGVDHRWLVPYSALLGAILLLLADIGARLLLMPDELPVGIVTAMLGVPFFVYIARRRKL